MHPNPALDTPPATAEEAVLHLLMAAGRKLRTRNPADGVDPSAFPLVRQLMCTETMRLSDLAAAVELDASTVSRQIKQLEDRELVERTPDPEDGRASLIRLTPLGKEEMAATFKRRFQRIQTALEGWDDDDRTQLRDLLTRLVGDLREASTDPAGSLTR